MSFLPLGLSPYNYKFPFRQSNTVNPLGHLLHPYDSPAMLMALSISTACPLCNHLLSVLTLALEALQVPIRQAKTTTPIGHLLHLYDLPAMLMALSINTACPFHNNRMSFLPLGLSPYNYKFPFRQSKTTPPVGHLLRPYDSPAMLMALSISTACPLCNHRVSVLTLSLSCGSQCRVTVLPCFTTWSPGGTLITGRSAARKYWVVRIFDN